VLRLAEVERPEPMGTEVPLSLPSAG
jgi:hypothetical protein